MSGFRGQGRLQDAEWLMRACMIMNRDLPPNAPDYTEESPLNQVYTQQASEFEELLAKIDPEGEIDRTIFPILAHFTAPEGWPLDIIVAAFAFVGISLWMPNFYGIMKYVAFLLIIMAVAIQHLRTRRNRNRAKSEMRKLGLDPFETHPLTLRMLVRYRKASLTLH
ncbi:MAG: hypothetical protein P8J78_06215 [Maricaulis sp.]|jgi:hypothetical protein|nr:hypothetical protein [Maricaulis sp.]MDG2044186.1 hypothetical protein [Maricaulis sp.]